MSNLTILQSYLIRIASNNKDIDSLLEINKRIIKYGIDTVLDELSFDYNKNPSVTSRSLIQKKCNSAVLALSDIIFDEKSLKDNKLKLIDSDSEVHYLSEFYLSSIDNLIDLFDEDYIYIPTLDGILENVCFYIVDRKP